MSDDGPSYSRNIDRRQCAVMVVCIFSFMGSSAVAGLGMRNLLGNRTDLEPGVPGMLILGTAVVSAFVTTALAGFSADRVHRSFWPEHPDEG